MVLSVPRLLSLVVAVLATYLGITALMFFAEMAPDERFGEIFWRAFWPIAMACGAYALWLRRPPAGFIEAAIRTGFILLGLVGAVVFVVSIF